MCEGVIFQNMVAKKVLELVTCANCHLNHLKRSFGFKYIFNQAFTMMVTKMLHMTLRSGARLNKLMKVLCSSPNAFSHSFILCDFTLITWD